MTPIAERVAAAPISWGVSEVPGWGHQMEPIRVLREMMLLGFHASEMGPNGYFAGDEEVRCRWRETNATNQQNVSCGCFSVVGFVAGAPLGKPTAYSGGGRRT